jgi:hypothetical protein
VIAGRIAWTVFSLIIAQVVICGLAAAPSVAAWLWLLRAIAEQPAAVRAAVIALALVPSYVLFAIALLFVSPIGLRVLGWRTPPEARLVIADMGWPLLDWARYGASLHVVRLLAGTWFRGSPLWTAHLRLNGARLGRRVYINTLEMSDYNLLECGDDVVIGGAAHLSGHTVEGGVVKTAGVRVGDRVTIGLGTVVEIGARIGSDTQIGAMSFVPKHAVLEGGQTYAGVPAAPLGLGQEARANSRA